MIGYVYVDVYLPSVWTPNFTGSHLELELIEKLKLILVVKRKSYREVPP